MRYEKTAGFKPPRRFYILMLHFSFLIQARLSHAIKGQHAPRVKFESRDEWLGIRNLGLGVTGDLNTTFGHLRLKNQRFLNLPAVVNRLLETHFLTLFHTASALSAPSGHLPLEGKAIHTRRQSRYQHFSFLIHAELSYTIKGRNAPRANPLNLAAYCTHSPYFL